MKNRLLTLIFAFLVVSVVNAQKCGTYNGYLEKQIQNYPDFYQKMQSKNQKLEAENQKAIKSISRFKNEEGKKIIPVVVHNIYNGNSGYLSDAVIQSAIDALNKNINGQSDKLLELYQNQYLKTPDIFAAVRGVANVEFRLAKIAPNDSATTGIIRIDTEITSLGSSVPDPVKALSYWNSYQYLNIWTVPSFGGDAGGGLLGYAQFPNRLFMSTDGVVLKSGEMGSSSSSTLTHEVGHWLGLAHIWGDAPCGDDNIKDTPTHRYDNNGASESSPTPNDHPRPNPKRFPYHVGLSGLDQDPPVSGLWGCVADSLNPAGEMFMNYMDYTSDDYTTMFSAGQIEVVNVTLEGEVDEESGVLGIGFRQYMWSAENKIATGTNDGYFNLEDRCSAKYDFYEKLGGNSVCLNTTSRFVSNSAILNLDVTAASWDFGDGVSVESDYSPSLIQGHNIQHTYDSAGVYDVTLMLDYNELRELRVSNLDDLEFSPDSSSTDTIILIVQGTESELVAQGASSIEVHIDLDGYSKNSYWVLDQLNTDNILDATYIDTIQTDSTLFYNGYFGDTLFYRGKLENITHTGYYKSSCQSTIVKENYITIGEVQASNTAYPYAYSFEDENEWNTTDWVLTQPQTTGSEWEFQSSVNTVWEWTSKASNSGNASIMIDSDNLKIGSTEIISPAYDLSSLTNPSLKFSWSGAASNTAPANELNVYYSSNCGKNWVALGTIDAISSANAGMYISNFSPNSSEWMDTVMTKNALVGNDNIMFKFEYVVNGSSNNFYLDNIMIGEESDLMIAENITSARLSIYPNPTDGKTFIDLNNLANKEVEVELINILGAEIMHLFSGEIVSNYHKINDIDFSHLETGIYFVKVVADGDVVMTDKLILK